MILFSKMQSSNQSSQEPLKWDFNLFFNTSIDRVPQHKIVSIHNVREIQMRVAKVCIAKVENDNESKNHVILSWQRKHEGKRYFRWP